MSGSSLLGNHIEIEFFEKNGVLHINRGMHNYRFPEPVQIFVAWKQSL